MVNQRRAAIERICRAMGVSILYAFGSRAHEISSWLEQPQQQLAPSSSDVDIGARAASGVFWSVIDKVDLALALEDLFDCPRVDLVVLNEADPFVAAEVIRGERLFADDTTDADEYDLYVLRRAGDLAPLERERLDFIFGVTS
jgi:Polymerase beta, Nucleotidyltransferase